MKNISLLYYVVVNNRKFARRINAFDGRSNSCSSIRDNKTGLLTRKKVNVFQDIQPIHLIIPPHQFLHRNRTIHSFNRLIYGF